MEDTKTGKKLMKDLKCVILVPKFTSKEIQNTDKKPVDLQVSFVYLIQANYLEKKTCLL